MSERPTPGDHRGRGGPPETDRPGTGGPGRDPGELDLGETLRRAVGAGVITAEQAERVAALAVPWPAGRVAARPAAPVLAEVLGYLGGAVTLVTAIVLGNELWDTLAVAVRVLVLVAVTAAAVGAGAGLRDQHGPAGRLAGFLWLIAVVSLAGTVAVAADGLGWDHRNVALAACLVGLVAAAVLWWLHPETLQLVALFAGVLATLVAVLARIGADQQEYVPIAIWVVGLAWLVATARGRLQPAAVGWILGSAAAAFGLLLVDWPRSPWLVVAVLTGIGLVTVGVRTQRWPVVAIGILGLLFAVPITLGELFGTALLPVWIALGIGLALLVGGVYVLHRPRARP